MLNENFILFFRSSLSWQAQLFEDVLDDAVAARGVKLEGLRDAERVYEKTTSGRARDPRQELHNAERADFFTGIQLKGSIHEEQLLAILLIDV